MSRVSKMYGDPSGYQIRFDRDTGELDVTSLKLGATAGASDGTALTPTAAEFNVLHSSGVTNADLVKVHAIASSAAQIDNAAATTATSAELNLAADASAQTETIAAAGAVSVTKRISKLALVGSGAVTLAAPDSTMLGVVKIIEMTVDNGDVTLALTNVDGGSAATTATFNDVGDALTLIGGVSKWHVLGEGATLS